MLLRNKVFAISAFLYLLFVGYEPTQASVSFPARINSNSINVRSDSTATSEVICTLNKGDATEVVAESYDWCKIRLPKSAPSFIKKTLVTMLDEKSAKVTKNSVNIRLQPNESSAILGRVNENEVVRVLEDVGEWYRIEAVSNSFGWVHKKFISKIPKEDLRLAEKPAGEVKKIREIVSTAQGSAITVEGTVRPKTIKTIATHKLICDDRKIYLLKGSRENLNALNYHKAKVTGRLINGDTQELPIIEIVTLEALD